MARSEKKRYITYKVDQYLKDRFLSARSRQRRECCGESCVRCVNLARFALVCGASVFQMLAPWVLCSMELVSVLLIYLLGTSRSLVIHQSPAKYHFSWTHSLEDVVGLACTRSALLSGAYAAGMNHMHRPYLYTSYLLAAACFPYIIVKTILYRYGQDAVPAASIFVITGLFCWLHVFAARRTVEWARRRYQMGLAGFGYPWEEGEEVWTMLKRPDIEEMSKRSDGGIEPGEDVPPEMLADVDSKFVEVSGIKVHYKEVVPSTVVAGGNDNVGVVLVHGFGGGAFAWRHVMEPLAMQCQCRVLAFDRPAFGLTSRPVLSEERDNPYTLGSQALMTLELCAALRLEHVVLVAHADGCLLALRAASMAMNAPRSPRSSMLRPAFSLPRQDTASSLQLLQITGQQPQPQAPVDSAAAALLAAEGGNSSSSSVAGALPLIPSAAAIAAAAGTAGAPGLGVGLLGERERGSSLMLAREGSNTGLLDSMVSAAGGGSRRSSHGSAQTSSSPVGTGAPGQGARGGSSSDHDGGLAGPSLEHASTLDIESSGGSGGGAYGGAEGARHRRSQSMPGPSTSGRISAMHAQHHSSHHSWPPPSTSTASWPNVLGMALLHPNLSGQMGPALSRLLARSKLGRSILRPLLRTEIGEVANRRAWHNTDKITPEVLELYKAPLRVEGWDMALVETTRLQREHTRGDLATYFGDVRPLPVLLVAGEHDRVVPLSKVHHLSADLPRSRVSVLPDCGHLSHEEVPTALLQHLVPFCGEALNSLSAAQQQLQQQHYAAMAAAAAIAAGLPPSMAPGGGAVIGLGGPVSLA